MEETSTVEFNSLITEIVKNSRRPSLPANNRLNDLIVDCWNPDSVKRPDTQRILETLSPVDVEKVVKHSRTWNPNDVFMSRIPSSDSLTSCNVFSMSINSLCCADENIWCGSVNGITVHNTRVKSFFLFF
eukprot:TRINITY_DN4562_c0_g2_i1.p1 TRINITY_DN4562_c0_g2~~TRINITY_DN4562_c0_g2_i1.p1  ORF type:complete len:130 (-),score=4.55 TRINITY_DN4562_c0_g2_i1:670-1059(-)